MVGLQGGNMLISELVEFLVGLEETYGDIFVCYANDEMIHSFKGCIVGEGDMSSLADDGPMVAIR